MAKKSLPIPGPAYSVESADFSSVTPMIRPETISSEVASIGVEEELLVSEIEASLRPSTSATAPSPTIDLTFEPVATTPSTPISVSSMAAVSAYTSMASEGSSAMSSMGTEVTFFSEEYAPSAETVTPPSDPDIFFGEPSYEFKRGTGNHTRS